MVVDMGIFALLAMRYKYVEDKNDDSEEEYDLHENEKIKGIENNGYSKSNDDP